MKKYVYLFTETEGLGKELLGGKGANLAEMTRLGLPVPQGFTITTEACTRYYQDGEKIASEIVEQIFDALAKVEKITTRSLATLKIPSSYLSVPAQEYRCPA